MAAFARKSGGQHPADYSADIVVRASAGRPRVTSDERSAGRRCNAMSPPDFRVIYDQWFAEVSRWIRALGGPDADREDIVQNVFLVVRRRLHEFDGVNLPAWLYRIARRQVRDFWRGTWVRHIFSKERWTRTENLAYSDANPAMALERKERQRVLYTLLQKMKEGRRTALVLFEIEGLSGEEIARIQGVPLNTVWTRLHHARKELSALAARHHSHERNALSGL